MVDFVLAKNIDDFKALESLAANIWRECYIELLGEKQVEYMLDKFLISKYMFEQYQTENYYYYLIKSNNNNAGFCAFAPQSGKLFLSKIYLLAEYRGSGIMAKFWSFAENFANENDCNKIWLTVNRGNARAVKAYEKAGFITVETQNADIGGGYFMEDYIMEKNLPVKNAN